VKRLFAVLALLLLAGCTQKVYIPVPYYVLPEDSWLTDVPVVPPPDRQQFLAADPDTRLSMCMGVYVDQVEKIASKNIDLKAARTWKADSKAKSTTPK